MTKVVKGLFGGPEYKPPSTILQSAPQVALPKAQAMPVADDVLSAKNKRRSAAEAVARGGRQSTILSNAAGNADAEPLGG